MAQTTTSTTPVKSSRMKRVLKWLLGIAIVALAGGGIFYNYKYGAILRSAPYQEVLKVVTNSKQIQDQLGTPIQGISWFPAVNLIEEADRGDAQLYFEVSGPKGIANVQSKASKRADGWAITDLKVKIKDQEVNLMPEVSATITDGAPKFDPNAKPIDPVVIPPPMLPNGTDINIEIEIPK
jgi:hypothetical protein